MYGTFTPPQKTYFFILQIFLENDASKTEINKNYQLNLHTIYISLIFIQCIYFLKQRDFYNNLTEAYFKLTPMVNAERYCETLQKLRSRH